MLGTAVAGVDRAVEDGEAGACGWHEDWQAGADDGDVGFDHIWRRGLSIFLANVISYFFELGKTRHHNLPTSRRWVRLTPDCGVDVLPCPGVSRRV